nr:ntcA [Porphyropsis coccinea]
MFRTIPIPTNDWLKILKKTSIPFEIIILKNGDSILLRNSNLIFINLKGILSIAKHYITKQSVIVSLNRSNTVLHYKTNDTICYYKLQALTSVHILILSKSHILNNLSVSNYFNEIELYSLNLELINFEYWITIFTQNTIKKRLVVFLLILAQQFGKPSRVGIIINVCVSHKYLAQLLCTTRITITRCFNQLKNDLVFSNKKITLFDPITLASIVLRE